MAVSVLAASSSFLFLESLDFTLSYFQHHPSLLILLPGTAVFTIWVYKKTERIRHQFPALSAPLVMLATLFTHGSGGSAGREAVAVQMSEAFTKQLDNWTQRFSWWTPMPTASIAPMAIAAGFAAIFGTPWAAIVFAVEPLFSRKTAFSKDHALSFGLVLAASLLANYFCLQLGAAHTQHPQISIPVQFWNITVVIKCLTALAALALAVGFYAFISRWSKEKIKDINPYLLAAIMSLSVIFLSQIWGTTYFSGLGLEQIRQSFIAPAAGLDASKKAFMTLLTQWAGLKGGEVTPLFAIGASFGSTLAGLFDLPLLILAGCGFIAFFAGQFQTPWAAALMGIELFGFQPALYFIITTWTCAQVARVFTKKTISS